MNEGKRTEGKEDSMGFQGVVWEGISRNFEEKGKGAIMIYEKETKITTLYPFILFNKHKKYSLEICLLWICSLDHSDTGSQLWGLVF